MTKVEKVTEGYDDAFQIHAYYDCTDIRVCAYLAGEGSREKKKNCTHDDDMWEKEYGEWNSLN